MIDWLICIYQQYLIHLTTVLIQYDMIFYFQYNLYYEILLARYIRFWIYLCRTRSEITTEDWFQVLMNYQETCRGLDHYLNTPSLWNIMLYRTASSVKSKWWPCTCHVPNYAYVCKHWCTLCVKLISPSKLFSWEANFEEMQHSFSY